MTIPVDYEISYGKVRAPLHRVYAAPLTGLTPVPESAFTGRENVLLAVDVDVEVFGDNFLAAYRDGRQPQRRARRTR